MGILALLYCLFGISLSYASILYVTRKINDFDYVTVPHHLPDLLLNRIPENADSFSVILFEIVLFFIVYGKLHNSFGIDECWTVCVPCQEVSDCQTFSCHHGNYFPGSIHYDYFDLVPASQ